MTNYGATSQTIGFVSHASQNVDWFSPTDTCTKQTLATGQSCNITFDCHPLVAATTMTMQVVGRNPTESIITNTLNVSCASP
jgi:hypothetical protein